MKRIAYLYLVVAVLFVGIGTIAARFLEDTPAKKGPIIKTDEDTYNFGSIKQGDVVEHVFTLRNDGVDTLIISNTQSSCGCTTSMLDQNHILPGQVGKLKAVFNSSGKMGHITKTIYIYNNDVTNPNKTVQITADIQTEAPSVHSGMMKGAVHLEGVFEGDCATCHVDKGRGLMGKELYAADCAICHGTTTDGKPGPEIHSPAIQKHSKEGLLTIITDGIPNSMMPAFGKAHQGPLNAEEINSLADYVSVTSKAAPTGVPATTTPVEHK